MKSLLFKLKLMFKMLMSDKFVLLFDEEDKQLMFTCGLDEDETITLLYADYDYE